jgi:transcriptional regulator with XRE-family HTH domain
MDKANEDLIEQIREIPLQADGFPIAGRIIELFRLRKGWSQRDLARKLGISNVMVHKIENKNSEISLERRRLLCKLLDIPPILLGLGTVEQLHEFFREDESVKHDTHANNEKSPIYTHHDAQMNVNRYNKVLQQYHQTTFTLSGLSLLGEIEVILHMLMKDTGNTKNMQEKKQFLILQWEFHRLAAVIYADFKYNMVNAMRHMNSALSVASQLHDANLLANTYAHIAALETLQGNVFLARPHIDAALSHLKNASDMMKCDTYALAARLYHTSAQDYGDVAKARSFIELSQGMSSDGIHNDGRYTPIGIDTFRCQRTQIDTYLKIKKASDAMSILDDIETSIPHGALRRMGRQVLYRAECYVLLKYPSVAIECLSEAFSIYKEIGEHIKIKHIGETLQQIKNSSYGNSPDVQALDMTLREYHATKHR